MHRDDRSCRKFKMACNHCWLSSLGLPLKFNSFLNSSRYLFGTDPLCRASNPGALRVCETMTLPLCHGDGHVITLIRIISIVFIFSILFPFRSFVIRVTSSARTSSFWALFFCVHGTLGCVQRSVMIVWRCRQLLSGFLAKGHLPRVSRLSTVVRVIMR